MSNGHTNLVSQQTALDNGLPYPKPISEAELNHKPTEKKKPEVLPGKKAEKKPENKAEKKAEKKTDKKAEKKAKRAEEKASEFVQRSPIQSWFNTFMIMNIPIIGWIYLFILAVSRKSDQKKDFARAYLVYKLVFFLVALAMLALVLYSGMEVADRLLRYMNML